MKFQDAVMGVHKEQPKQIWKEIQIQNREDILEVDPEIIKITWRCCTEVFGSSKGTGAKGSALVEQEEKHRRSGKIHFSGWKTLAARIQFGREAQNLFKRDGVIWAEAFNFLEPCS